jgi:hypothetical protein
MEDHYKMAGMNRRIFTMGLSTEAVSLYLLLCGLADEGARLTSQNILRVWNGTEDAFCLALETLAGKNIVRRVLSDGKGQEAYRVLDTEHWT